MKINYLLYDIRLKNIEDVEYLRSLSLCDIYKDEVVVNLYVDNENLLEDCLSTIRECRFGILRRLPLVNLYFNVDNIFIAKDLNNDIQNFITPIVRIDWTINGVIEKVKSVLHLFRLKGWKLQLLLDINSAEKFVQSIHFYNLIKCELFEEDICILFKFEEDKSLLECAYVNMMYVMDTLKFLGMRNNIIVDCLLKAVRQKETSICQEFENSYKDVMKELMRIDTEKYYGKKTLIRETMDDFALV